MRGLQRRSSWHLLETKIGLLLSLILLFSIATAYITPPDSWNLRDYYDIIKVNEINGSVSNFTTYEDAEGSSVTDLEGIDTDTNAETECSGTTMYYDGEGNCDDISGVYVQAADWTTIDDYPSACASDEAVNTLADTLTCIDTIENATKWGDCARSGDCIVSADVLDIDDIDVEADLNTYVDIAGDTMTGALVVQDKVSCDDWTNVSVTASQISDQDAGTDITADLEEEAHCSEHDGNHLSCDGEELDVDDDFVINTGDTMTGNLTLDTAGYIIIDSDNMGIYFGEDQDAWMYFDGTDFIIEVV